MSKPRPDVPDDAPVAATVEASPEELSVLVGPADGNRKLIEELLEVRLLVRGHRVAIQGSQESAAAALVLVQSLLALIRRGRGLTTAEVRYAARQVQRDRSVNVGELLAQQLIVTHRGTPITPKTVGQAQYVAAVATHDLTFCSGPAGTGKTYLAMAMAVGAFRDSRVSRIVLTRPIVEAGEALGFLPGDIMEKVDPYLRPLQDALTDIMGAERFRRHVERGVIEVIPLAYMRGRTLNDAFIVLDEAQNTTAGQMKMALTRLGFGSKMIVTGDETQSDLPPGQEPGLQHAMRVLSGLAGIAFCRLTGEDIVRHDLVQRIVAAYGEDSRRGRERHADSDAA